MPYELQGHTADVVVTATAATLPELFGSMADGLAAAGCEEWPATGGEPVTVAVSADRLEALLYDYLAELIYERDVRRVLPVDNTVCLEEASTSEGWSLRGVARGVSLERVDAREIKAVTYSELFVEETPDGWRARVVLDV